MEASNMSALRWALSGIRWWFVAAANVLDEDASARVTPEALRKLAKDCDAALALPPRQCDVGTAEEQAERFRRHCDKFSRDGMHEACPCCGKIPFAGCEFAWEQMPYAEEGGAAQ